MSDTIKKLRAHELNAYDRTKIPQYLIETLCTWINDCSFQDASVNVLDVGGGTGMFSDYLLERYINFQCIVLDNAKSLLQKNRMHVRKRLLYGSAEDIGELVEEPQDLILFNLVLHHFVTKSYSSTLQKQREILSAASKVLKPNGRIFVIEDVVKGIFSDNLCSFLINRLTSASNPVLARFVRRMGANTAGTGICFLGSNQWNKQFEESGLQIVASKSFHSWKINRLKSTLLTMAGIRHQMFTLMHNGECSFQGGR